MNAVYSIGAYPKQLTVRDGSTVTIRALQGDDQRQHLHAVPIPAVPLGKYYRWPKY